MAWRRADVRTGQDSIARLLTGWTGPKMTHVLGTGRVMTIRGFFAKERALGRFRVALTAARDPDGSPTAGACDVHGDGARVTRSLVASRRALVISAAQLPVAGLVAGRTRTRTAFTVTRVSSTIFKTFAFGFAMKFFVAW